MADVAENFRSFLIADLTIFGIVGSQVHQNTVPADKAEPYVFYRMAGDDDAPALDDAAGNTPFEFQFDVEGWASDAAVANSLKTALRNRLRDYRGTFGDQQVQGIFCQDHGEDYVFRGHNGDEGLHAESLYARVIPR